ncbi:hypothetical protein HYDPIDRAFT_33492 [Hydnomerulius pinastri MD-312]|uniref:Unplaced genomic scaffold scaffold_63, whole genome shotgun sequence n=1 Tax=Hydnomerulius pinastri MD-312 TaxID=994086 RepID=A0A0C9V1G9_9AGAM|nr:hypothetical protein HYDPIDRAFT_33492 [Hydnomerulius pinastri MD-312]
MHHNIITAMYTALSPQQSTKCTQDTLIGLAVEGPISTYFQPDAADLLNDLLVCMVVDENFAYTLLLNHHLNPLAIPHCPVSHLAECIHQANLICQDRLEFNKLYEPSSIPPTLEPLRALVRACTATHPPKPGSSDTKPQLVQGF